MKTDESKLMTQLILVLTSTFHMMEKRKKKLAVFLIFMILTENTRFKAFQQR